MAPSKHHETPEGWERINPTVNRMSVPGGWIYEMYGQGIVFVPEPKSELSLPRHPWFVIESGEFRNASPDEPKA